ncbi:MAG TPA: CsbD family protein [Vicinamibacteria bacterium]
MNEDTLKGNWMQLKGRVRKQWGKLTNDDMASIQGSREVLLGRLQERYGHTREEVEREFDDWSVKPR